MSSGWIASRGTSLCTVPLPGMFSRTVIPSFPINWNNKHACTPFLLWFVALHSSRNVRNNPGCKCTSTAPTVCDNEAIPVALNRRSVQSTNNNQAATETNSYKSLNKGRISRKYCGELRSSKKYKGPGIVVRHMILELCNFYTWSIEICTQRYKTRELPVLPVPSKYNIFLLYFYLETFWQVRHTIHISTAITNRT